MRARSLRQTSRLCLIPGRLIPAARAPGVRRLSFFEIVVTSVWESPHDFSFVVVQIGPGLQTAFAAPLTVCVSVHVTYSLVTKMYVYC